MKIKKFILGKMFIVFCFSLLINGCAKNSVVIEFGDKNDENGTEANSGGSTGDLLVTFHATIEGRNITRAMSPMKSGIKSQVFAYDVTPIGTSTESFYTKGTYVTTSPGVLAGVNGYKMYLSNGTYNFYAVSDNFSTIPPGFTNGQSEPLFNGIDYLWWNNPSQDVTVSQINVPIIFQHAGTQAVFDINEGNGIKLDKILAATITPPAPGARMDLFTGIIPAATTYGTADKMGINEFTIQYIMLPLRTATPMVLTLEVMVNSETSSRNYTVDVPVPNGELKAGDSYLFKAIIDENTITFPSVSIKDWTEVDETGNPLYPVQK